MDNSTLVETEAVIPILNSSPKKRNEEGWTGLLALAAVITTLSSALPAGYNIGVVNNPQGVIKKFCNETIISRYDVVLSPFQFDVLWSSIVSIFIVGGVVGSFSGAWAADRFGRKGSIHIGNILGIVAAVCFILSKEVSSVELLLVGRFVIGLSSGLVTAVVPMYLTELSPLRLRGAVGVMCPLGITIGVLLSQILGLNVVLGTAELWHILFAFYLPLIVFSYFVLNLLPESPKYLYVVRGLEDQATKELQRVRKVSGDVLALEIQGLRDERGKQSISSKRSASSVLCDPKLRLPLLIVIALQAGQQLSGVNAVFYYSSEIFKNAGLTELQAQLGSLGAGVVNLGVAILSVYTMQRFSRRPLILTSCIGAAASLALLIISISYNKSADWLTYVPIIAVLLYVFLYGLGLGPIPYFIGSELFEVGPRPVAMASGAMANWGGNFLVGMTFPSLNNAIGQFVFLFYISVVLALVYFLFMYFPETKGIEQHEVACMLQNGFRSKVRSRLNKPRS